MAQSVQQSVLMVNLGSQATCRILSVLAAKGIHGRVVRDMDSAAAELEGRQWDLVLAGSDSANGGAQELVRGIRDRAPDVPVVLVGTDGTARAAVRAMQAGCQDYLVAPPSPEALEEILAALMPHHEVPLVAGCAEPVRWQMAGRSPRLLETIQLARKVAPTSAPVLITGESGSGKELLCHLVHHESNRRHGPYVRVNCAALSESLLESELFGHERGAFTGAHIQRKGRFERAHGGTLLLDEISETGPQLQSELLRVLEQQELERVGGTEPVRVDVRVICTSNRDLGSQVEMGRFRRDLYYRISGLRLTVPPLRERKEDLPALVWHFVNQYAGEVRRQVTELDQEMLEAFARHSWPGNVRELRNVIRTALILGEGTALRLHPTQRLGAELWLREPAAGCLSLQELERRAIFEALRRTKSHQAKAARLLGITDRTLREKLRRYRQDGKLQPVGEGRWTAERV